MFEKFTEKAINVLTIAQENAKGLGHSCLLPEHLLLGLIAQKSCLSTKLLSFSGVKQEKLYYIIKEKLKNKEKKVVPKEIAFSSSLKDVLKTAFDIAKQLNNRYILTEHLFIAVLKSSKTEVKSILAEFNFDIPRNIATVNKFLDKKKKNVSRDYHPENTQNADIKTDYQNIFDNIKNSTVAKILENAAAKLSTSNYEILGTEQIIQAILEDSAHNPETVRILNECGLNPESFNAKMAEIQNRNDEFEGKQIIFTPNAFKTMLYAMEFVKELGAVTIEPEHIILGLLQSKNGIAYKILKKLNIDDDDLRNKIIRPIEKQKPETLTILRLSKEETRRLGKSVVGSEMILLGILGEGVGVAAQVLSELGITIKDVRAEIEKIVGLGDEYTETQISFTPRAKKIIELAWNIAKSNKLNKINSEHLLEAITKVPNNIAMKVLSNLGVDVVEIKQGILKFL